MRAVLTASPTTNICRFPSLLYSQLIPVTCRRFTFHTPQHSWRLLEIILTRLLRGRRLLTGLGTPAAAAASVSENEHSAIHLLFLNSHQVVPQGYRLIMRRRSLQNIPPAGSWCLLHLLFAVPFSSQPWSVIIPFALLARFLHSFAGSNDRCNSGPGDHQPVQVIGRCWLVWKRVSHNVTASLIEPLCLIFFRYLLTTAAFQLPFGKLYSILSVKWTFLVTIIIFEIGSLICGAANSSAVLIAGRAIAGVGGAGIFSGALIIAAHTSKKMSLALYELPC